MLEIREIGLDFGGRRRIVFLDRQFEQFARIGKTGLEFVEDVDNLF